MRRVLVPILLLSAVVAGAVELCSNVDGIFHEIRCNASYSTLLIDNTNLVLDCTNNRVGVGTSSPSEALQVVGNVKASGSITATGNITTSGILYGSGVGISGIVSTGTVDAHTMSYSTHGATDQATASRMMVRDASGGVAVAALTASSITTTGDMSIAVGTFTVAGGMVNVPSQPGVTAKLSSDFTLQNNSVTVIPWNASNFNQANIFNQSNGTITIPSGGDGLYDIVCSLRFDVHATGARIIQISVGGIAFAYGEVVANSASYPTNFTVYDVKNLTAGQLLTCEAFQDSGTTLKIKSGIFSKFSVVKRGG